MSTYTQIDSARYPNPVRDVTTSHLLPPAIAIDKFSLNKPTARLFTCPMIHGMHTQSGGCLIYGSVAHPS